MSDPRHDSVDVQMDSDDGPVTFLGTASFKPWPSIRHYYGDTSRQLLLAAAALMLIASPLYGDNLRIEFPFEVIGALFATGFAALTDPRGRMIAMGDCIISGVGIVVYAGWGLSEYDVISPIAFILRIAVAVIFLFAFYFSMKTMRAFTLHEIGKRESVDDFESEREKELEERLERETNISRS